MKQQFEIIVYQTRNGHSPLESWLSKLKDRQARLRIMRRIQRLSFGNFGDHRNLGNGISELRIDYGPGYRVYYCVEGNKIVLLLCAGDKKSQSADIKKAEKLRIDYMRERNEQK